MRVVCRHGHFAFYPNMRSEVLHFKRLFKTNLERSVDGFFTFESLADLPRWSQVGRTFGNLPAVVTHEGRGPWDVMKANDFVLSLSTMALVARRSIIATVNLRQTLDCAVYSRPLLQPGSMIKPGVVLTGYDGEIDLRFQKLYVYAQETGAPL